MSIYQVDLVDDGEVTTVEVREDETVLEAAERVGVDVEYSCRMGQCTSCTGKVREGDVDQSGAVGLDPTQKQDGYTLLCVAEPTEDSRIEIDAQADLFELI